MPEALRVERLDASREDDFFALHADANACGWCRCVAWWVEGWEGWGSRSAHENRALREALFARGQHDGLLAYVGGAPVGWCQLGPRDRLEKLRAGAQLARDPAAWAVSCFVVAPALRGRGVAAALLEAAVAVARDEGARVLEGFPKRGPGLSPGEAWTGPEALFRRAGFARVADAGARAVWRLTLDARPTPGAATPR